MSPRLTGRIRAHLSRPSERRRQPQPLLRTRLPHKRGATEQPNVTPESEAELTPRFWLALILTGLATGLMGAGLMALLFHVEDAAFGGGNYQSAVIAASGARRVTSLVIAGAFGGVAWYLLRRFTRGERTEIDDVIWTNSGELSFRRALGSGVISEVVIGLGASIGREAAPKTMGGVFGGLFARYGGLDRAQQRLLIACGGGAGLAAVYNVPLGGAFFTAEILLGTVSLATMLPALGCAWIATLTAWIYLPDSATYTNVPEYHITASLLVFSLLAGPVIGVLSAGYVRLIGWVSTYQVRGVWSVPAVFAALAALGLIGLAYPQLFGNGKDMAHDAFLGHGTVGLLLALAVLKPLVTSLCLSSGATGGLFTPVMSTGAVLGAGSGLLWSQAWHGTPTGAFATVGAAAMIGASMQAPITALALALELTHSGFGLMVPMMAATVLATLAVRVIDGYSIYTARLPAAESRAAAPPRQRRGPLRAEDPRRL